MTKVVIKSSGEEQAFDEGKLNRWAEYATVMGASWSELSLETYKRLPDRVTSAEIHQTMINVCLYKEELAYSRTAARLEFATIRKGLYSLGLDDKDSFKNIYSKLLELGIWDKKIMPKYTPDMEDLYKTVCGKYLEYWQVKQWIDKYRLKHNGAIAETPHMGAIGIGFALFGNTQRGRETAIAIIEGQINLPTPALNGVRNGDNDSISCCVITGGDTVDSIGAAVHIAYKMTAKKAGIGIEMDTRSLKDDVKGGAIPHLGKQPIYATVDKAVKMFTQVSRGGSATVTYKAIDPDIELLLSLKSQRTPENVRLDKLDYSLAYNDTFIEAVVKDRNWHLFSLADAPEVHTAFYGDNDTFTTAVEQALLSEVKHTKIKARALLKLFLMSRQETGRVYCINVSRANNHTPFLDTIKLSNLCQEICLPTAPYTGLEDLIVGNDGVSEGETAFCCLSALNIANIPDEDYERIAKLALYIVNRMIDTAPMMTKTMAESIKRRRSAGIGITGLAGYLYQRGLDYDASKEALEATEYLAQRHYYYLLKASQDYSEEFGVSVEGIDKEWLPIDTAINPTEGLFDWEALRGKDRANSVLVAHMPTESSAVFSNATNGLYPVRQKVINKLSRHGNVQYLAPKGNYKTAWEVDNNDLAKYYSIVQNFTDQGISADYYVDFNRFPSGKVPLSQLMKEWVYQARLGVKTMYYVNTNDETGGSFQDLLRKAEEEEACDSCKL